MMAEASVLVLDLGTTHLKATVFNGEGDVLGQASAPYPTHAPRTGWAEQDPDRWWDAAVRAGRVAIAAAEESGRGPRHVRAIGLTGQMHGVVLVDGQGTVLGPCLTVQDRRAVREVSEIEAEMEPGGVYALAGARLEPASPLAKLRWLARRQPDLLERASLLLPPKDYLRFRLTGEAATEPIDAAGTMLYDLRRGAWSPELVGAARIPAHLLPPVQPMQEVAGPLSGEAAAALGLATGIPVTMGAGDDVECLGAGLLAAGQGIEHLGTTGSILVCSKAMIVDPAGRVDCYPHAVPGMYLVGGSTSSAGATLAWAASELAGDGESMEEEVAAALLHQDEEGDGADLVFLPYLAGERCPVWHGGGRGLLVGMTLATTRRQIVGAAFAGVAFSLRHILDCIADLGLAVETLVVSGGGGTHAGRAWPVWRSAVYNRPLLQPPSADSTSLGALILAAVALGFYPDARTAAERLVPQPVARLEPPATPSASIERRYALYRAVAGAATPMFDRWLP